MEKKKTLIKIFSWKREEFVFFKCCVLLKFSVFEASLIYSGALISPLQHGDSVIHVYILFHILFHIVYYMILNIGPCAVE